MMVKTVLGLATALAIASTGTAFAQSQRNVPYPYQYRTYQSAPAGLYGDPGPSFGEPASQGAGHMPGAFFEQEQPGFPQSPPEGGY